MRMSAVSSMWFLGLALLVSGCGATVAGQAELASGAEQPPSILSSAHPATPTTSTAPTAPPTPAASTVRSDTGQTQTSRSATATTVSSRSSTADGTTGGRGSTTPPAVPGLSPACTQVEAAITAFGTLFDGGDGSDAVISPATAAAALRAMPASGLPAQPQRDIDVMRTVVTSAGGKTLTELAMALTDGKATDALEDLGTWAAQHCS